MKWPWKIGRFAVIPVNLHATFLLLLVWAGRRAASTSVAGATPVFPGLNSPVPVVSAQWQTPSIAQRQIVRFVGSRS
jgi:hypothetical protein